MASILYRFRKIIFLFCLVVLLTSVVNLLIFGGSFNSDKPPEPSTSPIPSLSPFVSPTPSLSPATTQAPNPTYVPLVQNYTSRGYIYVTGVDIYGGDLQGNAIQWDTLYIGDSKNVSFYVQSESNVPVILAYSASDWAPIGIDSYLSLSWDYNGTSLSQYQTIFVTLTLTSPFSTDFAKYLVDHNVTSFSFNIHISSTKL
jgi:hypothetical protein